MKTLTAPEILDNFDPNKASPNQWATFCVNRSPLFRLHPKRPQALNAISSYNYGILYVSSCGRWTEVCRKAREDHNGACSHCGRSTIGPKPRYGYNWAQVADGLFDTGHFSWKRDSHGRISDPPELLYLCEVCQKAW